MNKVRLTNSEDSPTGVGRALHPTRQLSVNPKIFEFGTPIGGTYPPWLSGRRHEGIGVRRDLKQFAQAIQLCVSRYQYWFHRRQTIMIGGILILLLLVPPRQLAAQTVREWRFLAFAAFPFVMYGMFTVESRYVQPSFAMLWTALFAILLGASREVPRRVVGAVTAVVTGLMLLEAALAIKQDYVPDGSVRIAEEMKSLGVGPGDAVAIIGNESYNWVRLARARVVSEVCSAGRPGARKQRSCATAMEESARDSTGHRSQISCFLGSTRNRGSGRLDSFGRYRDFRL